MENLSINFYNPILIGNHKDSWNQNTAYAVSKISHKIEPSPKRDGESIAIVGLGPSLLDTWQDIKKSKYIISVSGAHRFLIDRGIIPTWHVEADSSEHKIDLMGDPHPDVEYLVCSICHPRLIDYLAGFNVRIWYPNLGISPEDRLPAIPEREWRLNGGSNAGSRAVFIASFMGFPTIDLFGIDCSYPSENHAGEHAIDHPTKAEPMHRVSTEFNGKTYYTTPLMLTNLNEYTIMKKSLRHLTINAHGNGLLQDVFKTDYVFDHSHGVPKDLWVAVR